MRRHPLRVLQQPAVFQVGRDPPRPPGMTADPGGHVGCCRPALDHPVGVRLGQRLAGAPLGRAEQEAVAIVADRCGIQVGIDLVLERVVRRHRVLLAALLVQPHPSVLADGVVVADAHGDDRADAGKGEQQRADQRTVAQPDQLADVDGRDQRLASSRLGMCVLPVAMLCFGLRTAAAGLCGTPWPTTSQSNGIRTAPGSASPWGRPPFPPQLLDPRRDMHWFDARQH